jgi:hypothetical protein
LPEEDLLVYSVLETRISKRYKWKVIAIKQSHQFSNQTCTIMPLASDINLNAAKFRPDAVSEQTKAFNQHIVDATAGGPTWWEVIYLTLCFQTLKAHAHR